ncbi:MAG: HEAT repeat domain-containing protein [Planctomycetes bacterium]|nr:HEAT repeat domain-containing protein [Planctomycetota bacterium]
MEWFLDMPMRIRLEPAGEKVNELPKQAWEIQSGLQVLGFADVGAFVTDPESRLFFALANPVTHVYAAIGEGFCSSDSYVDYVTPYADGSYVTYTTNEASPLFRPSDKPVVRESRTNVFRLYDRMLADRRQAPFASVSVEGFVPTFERYYAEYMDWLARCDRSVKDLILDLAGDDSDACERAGRHLTARSGRFAVYEAEDPDKQRFFDEEVAAIFGDPDFPCERVLRGLVRNHTRLGQDDFLFTSWASRYVAEAAAPAAARAVPFLISRLDGSPNTWASRELICEMLRRMGQAAASAAPALLKAALKIGAHELPNRPAETLAAVTGEAPTVLQAVIEALSDQDANRRYGASYVLAEFGTRAACAIPALLKATEHHDPDTRSLAAMALGPVAKGQEEAFRRLVEMAQDKHWFIRGNAIESLGRLGLHADQVVPTAIGLLDDREGHDWSPSECAVRALGRFGRAALAAVPAIARRLKDWDDFPRDEIEALGKIGGSEAVEALEELYGKVSQDSYQLENYGKLVRDAIDGARREV